MIPRLVLPVKDRCLRVLVDIATFSNNHDQYFAMDACRVMSS